MNRAERRSAKRAGIGAGRLRPIRLLTREQAELVQLQLLLAPGAYGKLHAGLAKGVGPGRPLCEQYPSLFQHPLFARDPNFGPAVKYDLRHQYAIAALQLNGGCVACLAQLEAIGRSEKIDSEYPYLDPVKAEG